MYSSARNIAGIPVHFFFFYKRFLPRPLMLIENAFPMDFFSSYATDLTIFSEAWCLYKK